MNEAHPQDFFDLYFDYNAETECPLIYHRWCAIAGISALLGRRFYLNHGHSIIYPNAFTMLIGSPGTRKSTAIGIIRNLLRLAGYNTFASNKTTKEKFLSDLAEGFIFASGETQAGNRVSTIDGADEMLELDFSITEPREVFITADEFADFLGANNTEFISLLTTLWDCLPSYSNRIKTGKSVHIHQPTINILSGNTPTGFAIAFPPEIIGQGFLSRLLLIYGETTGRRITFPASPSLEDTAKLVEYLKVIQSSCVGNATFTSEATKLLEQIYTKWRDLDDSRLKSYSTRRFTHLLKLCLVCAAAKCRIIIDADTVIYANSILSYAELHMSRALGEFGKSKHSDVAGKICQFLEERTEEVNLMKIWKHVHQDLEKIGDLASILQNLVQAEKVQRTQKGFLIRKELRVVDGQTVNFKLLKEAS